MKLFAALTIVIVAAGLLPGRGTVHVVSIDLSRPLQAFDPREAVGADIDGHERGDIARLLTRRNIAAMRSAGLKPLSYRLRTELAGEAWHWNPKGTWSDPVNQQGYWVSDASPSGFIDVSYGYRLPRRGNTGDEANEDGYSRITDGDAGTFWKSNPYLGTMPQWVVVDFGESREIDSVRIRWGSPWARDYSIQYSIRDDVEVTAADLWHDLPNPTAQAPDGGDVMTRIAPAPLKIRKFRVLMKNSSGRGNTPDWRDSTGFAIREIEAGVLDGAGRLQDAVRHAPERRAQTVVSVSSTDPWHRASDRDNRVEQPGFDRVFRDGLSNGLPMLTPAGILYDTPENAVAELRYLRAKTYPVEEFELGEEPEEQQIPPEMYGALYRRWAPALHAVDPKLRIGGPSLVLLAPEAQEHPSWTKRWIADMQQAGALSSLQFFSFEWYPFDQVCEPVAPQLARSAELLWRSLNRLVEDGVPREVPWYMTEYGYSAYGSRAEVELPGAILNAETVAAFLKFGGVKTFLYGYEPGELIHERTCAGAAGSSWGNNMLFLSGPPLQKMPTYYGAKLLSEEWLQREGGRHTLFPAQTDDPALGVFAVQRPDRLVSLLLLNKSADRSLIVHVPLSGEVKAWQYSTAQYKWHSAAEHGRPVRNLPPVPVVAGAGGEIRLPPYSITVVRGNAAN